MAALLLLVVLFGISDVSVGLLCSRSFKSASIRYEHALGAVGPATNLIRKNKVKENDKLLAEVKSNPEHSINQYLKDGSWPPGIVKPINFYNTVKVKHNSISVMPEYNKKSKTFFISGMPPPEIMGGVLRDAGAKAIVASVDPRTGGTSHEEFERLVREQCRSRTFMPGPISIVYSDFVMSELQIDLAASLGAAAITLHPDYTDDFASLVAHSKKRGLEPIALAETVDAARFVIESGCRCVCLQTLDEVQLVAARKQLEGHSNVGTDDETLFMARLRPESDFSAYAEIDTAWLLRDNGFHCVWPSTDAVYATEMADIYTTVLAMRSKASRIFMSPRQFLIDRKNEGSKEYLGDILY